MRLAKHRTHSKDLLLSRDGAGSQVCHLAELLERMRKYCCELPFLRKRHGLFAKA